MQKTFLLCAAVSGSLAIVLGAFAAHGLRQRLGLDAIIVWQTGVQYQMYHALALLAVALIYRQHPSKTLKLSGLAFILGSLLFSGSLYLLALGAPHGLGIITPLGGLSFLIGWLLLTLSVWRVR